MLKVYGHLSSGNCYKVFLKLKCETREARPKDSRRIPPTNSEFLARLRALIFRQEAGSKSRAIQIHSICFGYKKNFCFIFRSAILNVRQTDQRVF